MNSLSTSMSNYQASLRNPLSPNYVSRLSMIPPISMKYALWSLSDEARKDIAKDRIASGISRTDTYSFDTFMAGAIVNGIINLDVTTHPLHKGKAWINFLSENTDVNEPSFEDALLLIATSMSEYYASNDAFLVHRGEEKLARVLKTFLALLPHLHIHEKAGSTTLVDPMLDVDEFGTEPTERHRQERIEYAISWSDSVNLSKHLSKIFAHGFRILAKETHSHPHDISFGHWQRELRAMADAFQKCDLNGVPLSAENKDEFIQRFRNYWD